jgi:hypothetical protein
MHSDSKSANELSMIRKQREANKHFVDDYMVDDNIAIDENDTNDDDDYYHVATEFLCDVENSDINDIIDDDKYIDDKYVDDNLNDNMIDNLKKKKSSIKSSIKSSFKSSIKSTIKSSIINSIYVPHTTEDNEQSSIINRKNNVDTQAQKISQMFEYDEMQSDYHNEPRKISKWVDDTSVNNCYSCKSDFSMLFRKHHCRMCGRVFCSKCSDYYTKLPTDILKIPDRPITYANMIWVENTKDPMRVCRECYEYANKLTRIKKIIKVFELCAFTIKDLYLLSKISDDYRTAAKFCIDQFREIQYKLSIESLTLKEKRMIWTNRKFLTGHSRWMIQLVKATNMNNAKHVAILENLMYKEKLNKCSDTQCTRFCSEKIELTDMLDLIKYNDNHPIISNYIVKCLSNINNDDLIDYLPFLVNNIKNNDYLVEMLMKPNISFRFMSSLYWSIKVYYVDDKNYKNDVTTMKELIIKLISYINAEYSNDFKRKFKSMIKKNSMELQNISQLNKEEKITLPICTDIEFVGVNHRNVKTIQSNSLPMIIPFTIDKETKKEKLIMFKNDDVRKDHIIMNIISIINDILKKEESDMDIQIVKYDVMPTSNDTGYIEIVENASTIFNIVEKNGKTIQNYILQYNRNITYDELSKKFINSTALYCVISYLFGIGDRHLDNIMVSKDGLLFHIDFGFILGQDPKYTNNKLIRVTPEIINVIGGYGTDDYNNFKNTCIRIYNRLRLHVNLFSNLLSVIPSVDPSITIDTIRSELTDRFEIGANQIEAATHMDNKVENKNNFEYMIIDFTHKAMDYPFIKGITTITKSLLNNK